MKNNGNIFTNIISRYLNSFKRLLISQIINICFGLFICLVIITEFQNSNFQISIYFGFSISLLVSYLLYYYSKNKIINYLVPIIVLALSSAVYYFFIDNSYILMIYIGISLILILLFINAINIFSKGNVFIYYFSNSLIVSIIFTILSFGLSICILCFSLLLVSSNSLFESNIFPKIIFSLYIILITFCSGLTISFLPKKNEKISNNKIFIIIFSCIPLFIYYLLIIIIYFYILKIIITWSFPVGVISPIASFVYLLYLYFSYVSNDNYKISKFHQKYGSYFIIPIFIVQQLTIIIRISAYGLTTLRFISIVFNILCLLFVIFTLINKRNLYLYVCSLCILIFTFIPYINFIDLPVLEQEFRLERVLERNNMLNNDTALYANAIDYEDKQIIISCYDYLINSKSNIVKSKYKNIDLNLIKVLNNSSTYIYDNEDYEQDYVDEIEDYINCTYFPDATNIDVTKYSKFDYFDLNSFDVDDPDFLKFINDAYAKYGNSLENGDSLYYINKESELIVFDFMNFHMYSDNHIKFFLLTGYKFYN